MWMDSAGLSGMASANILLANGTRSRVEQAVVGVYPGAPLLSFGRCVSSGGGAGNSGDADVSTDPVYVRFIVGPGAPNTEGYHLRFLMKPSAGFNVSDTLELTLPPFVNASAAALNTSDGFLLYSGGAGGFEFVSSDEAGGTVLPGELVAIYMVADVTLQKNSTGVGYTMKPYFFPLTVAALHARNALSSSVRASHGPVDGSRITLSVPTP
ncbi:hypothetical protein T484DRAFT_1864157 [Baffinella frigidus]|nr:hypothetical protein T484DRAFT_1864157 [Cryptophyta sp. CCMP2293]